MNFSAEEIKEFMNEATELLDGAEQSLLALDGGAKTGEHFDAVFRTFHSIKGAAGMMEMKELQSHMHQVENLLTQLKGKADFPHEAVDFFLRAVDSARKLLDGQSVEFSYEFGPAAQSDRPAKVAAPIAPTTLSLKVGKAYIVDDEPEIVEYLSDILLSAGFEVKGATQAKTALEEIPSFRPDVVLTDLSMPELSGFQLLEALRATNAELPVIFVSGHVGKDILIKSISLGIFGVIEKPFVANHVSQLCLNACRQHQLNKLLNKSINLLLYQFADLDNFLKEQGKEAHREILKKEMEGLLASRQELKRMGRKAH